MILVLLLQVIHKKIDAENLNYHVYVSRIVDRLELANMLPLGILTLVIVVPFWILLSNSLKSSIEANLLEFTWFPKEGVDLQSYVELFTYGESIGVTMGKAIVNSFVYAIIPTTVGLFISSLSAYAFSKMHFKGRDTLYAMLIATMMMPHCVTLATSYLMYSWYGWTGTALPLIVPGLFGTATTVMFLREYFLGIPDGLLEAARIDGASRWKIFFEIMLPLGKPALIAQFVLGFITKFNDYLNPLIYLNNPQRYTIQIAINFLEYATQDKTLIASACVFALAPMLLLYTICQKVILNGISMSSGIKG